MSILKRVGGAGVLFLVLGLVRRGAPRKRTLRRARLQRSYALAAKDPVFMAELDEIERDFRHTLNDGLEGVEPGSERPR